MIVPIYGFFSTASPGSSFFFYHPLIERSNFFFTSYSFFLSFFFFSFFFFPRSLLSRQCRYISWCDFFAAVDSCQNVIDHSKCNEGKTIDNVRLTRKKETWIGKYRWRNRKSGRAKNCTAKLWVQNCFTFYRHI